MKKHINKIIGLILILSFSIACVPFASEAENAFSPADEAGCLIEALQIEAFDESELSEGITRGEFAGMVCKLRGYEAPFLEDELSEERMLEFMNILKVFNVVSGYSDGDYRVNNPITYNEAYTMLVRCLGFGAVAEGNGGYPGGYTMQAARLGLNAQLSEGSNKTVTKKAALQLCFNTLLSQYLELQTVGDKVVYAESQKTLLNSIFRVYSREGILDGVDISRLAGLNDVKPYYISVDGYEIERADYNCYELLGYNVRVYYKLDNNAQPQLLYIYQTSSNSEKIIRVGDIADISGNSLVYYTEGLDVSPSTAKISFDSFKYFIYNGVSTNTELDMSVTDGKNGAIRFIDNDNDGKYEVICAEIYEDYVVSKTDLSNRKLYDKLNNSKSISLDTTADDPYTIIYDEGLNEIGIEGISEGDVVSIYRSAADAHQGYIRCFVSRDSVKGELSVIEGGSEKITVASVEYTLTEICRRFFENKITVGGRYTLFLNKEGLVANIEPDSETEMLFGYLKKLAAVNSYSESCIYLRICNLSGSSYSFNTYKTADGFTVDGVSYRNSRENDINNAASALHLSSQLFFGAGIGSDVTAQFIMYKLDNDGNISQIDTAAGDSFGTRTEPGDYETPGNTMYLLKGDNLNYRQSTGTNIAYLGTQIHCRKNTQVFNYPFPTNAGIDYENEELYYMSTAEDSFSTVGRCAGTLHAVYSRDKFRADYLGREYSPDAAKTIGTHERIAAIDRVVKAVNEDGEGIYKIEAYGSNQNLIIKCKEKFTFAGFTSAEDASLKATMTPADLIQGDLIRYTLDKDGYVSAVNFYYRADGDIINPAFFTNAAYNSSNRFNKAYVMKKYEDGYLIAIADTYAEASVTDRSEWEYITEYDSSYTIMYDASKAVRSRVSIASYVDLTAFEDAGPDCSQIIIHQYNGFPFGLYIIKP